jgi:DNA-binding CsgD family transcriptional regulator
MQAMREYHASLRRNKVKAPRTDFVTREPTFDVAAACIDYEAGLSVNECAAKHGVSRETIRRQLIKAGTEMRPNTKGRPIDTPAVVSLYGEGVIISEIAARLGYSYSGCYKALRGAGVEIRDDRPRSAS